MCVCVCVCVCVDYQTYWKGEEQAYAYMIQMFYDVS